MPLAEAGDSGRSLTLGTAGHIDHGKTALIEALTGTNTDRLAEERRRGISIELGYAELTLPNGTRLSVVDVPGHERLVRTMVAGATGIDLFLLVVAADDGVMPQTLEHLAVLRALGVDRGVVALTKTDLAEPDALALSRNGALTLAPGRPLVDVSARTGEGLDALRRAIAQVAADLRREAIDAQPDEPAVLHVDRVFTLKGIGTVATGTLRSGQIGRGDRVEILPRGLQARVRGVEVHGRSFERVGAGQRVAVNLAGVRRADLDRGDVIVSAGAAMRPSYRLDVELHVRGPTDALAGQRVQVHHGTRNAPARVVPLSDDGLGQLRLESPLIARRGDRVVIRQIAPADTLGGGVVLDPAPPRHGRGAQIESAGQQGEGDARPPEVPSPGVRPLDRTALLALALLERDAAEPRSPQAIAEALRIDRRQALDALDALTEHGKATRLKPDVYFATDRLEPLRHRLVEMAIKRGELTLSSARDELGTSRKYAQALVEHLDAMRVTVRQGDRHLLRQRH